MFDISEQELAAFQEMVKFQRQILDECINIQTEFIQRKPLVEPVEHVDWIKEGF